MTEVTYLSREGYEKLTEELRNYIVNERSEISRQIAEARDKGDLSENAEYDAAKEEQGLLELRISKMEDVLSRASVIDITNMPKDQAHILSTLTVKNLNNSKTYKYTLVSPEEADIDKGKISITSPVGQALMGTKAKQVVQAKVPAGLIKFEILKLE